MSFVDMEDTHSVSSLIDSTTSKIQQLQKAFAELEGHRAVTLNFKWKQLEEHFHGLEKSLKRRFHELEDQEKEYETKMMKAQEMLERRETAIIIKEEDSLERLQQKRDEAVFSISTVLDKHRKVLNIEPAVVSNEGHGILLVVEEKPPDTMTTEFSVEMKSSCENGNAEIKCYPQLVNLCTEMDSKGLHKLISDNRKNLVALKEEIPIALKASPSPANLVLTSLEGFYSMDVPNPDGKKDPTLLGVRRTCIMLMECLVVLLTNPDLSSASIISEDVKNLAKAVAEEWKPRLDDLDIDANNGNSLEAHAFLQLLVTFGVASDFDQDMLSRLIPMVSRRHQAADLCRSLGLAEKMTGVIDVLKNSGRQIDAVNLAFAFELTEQFSPVPLLKSYLKEVQKVSSPVRSGSMSPPTAQNDVNERELTALKAVIKCIEEHKLEVQYPIDPLQKQMIQIEKAKAEKKRATEVTKPQPKRPRATTITYAPRINNVPAEKTFYTRATERYPPYVYDSRPYGYQHGPIPIDNQGHSAYNNHPHYHGNYFGNCYQYQVPPYLH